MQPVLSSKQNTWADIAALRKNRDIRKETEKVAKDLK